MSNDVINLNKGENKNLTDLTKDNPSSLTSVTLGLGWDSNLNGREADLDASALILGADGMLLSAKHFVYFNNLVSPDGKVKHNGDNLTGEGVGDDETIAVALAELAAEVSKVLFVVNIYDAEARGQNFGQVKNAFIRLMDNAGTELVRFDLSEDASGGTGLLFAELYRHNGDWKFKAVAETKEGGAQAFVDAYSA